MRGTLLAGALAAGVLLAGAGPALASGGGNDTSAKLRKAVSVDGIRLHQAAFNVFGELKGGNRLAGTPGHELSADYVELNAKLGGAARRAGRTSRTTSTSWGTGRSRSSTSSAARATSRASAGRSSAATSARWSTPPSGDVTGPVWAADLSLPAVSGGEHVDLGLRGGGLRRDAEGRDRADPARHLRRADQVAQRAGRRRGRDRLHQRGHARRARRARLRAGSTWRGRASRSRSRPRRSRPSPTSRAASARASSARPRACGSSGARTRPSRPQQRHRGDPRR